MQNVNSPYWNDDFKQQPKLYLDTDKELRNDPEINNLLVELESLVPSSIRPSPCLNIDGWETGYKIHPDRDHVQEMCNRNASGWIPTRNPLINCKGTNTNYKAKAENIKEGLKALLRRIKQGHVWGPFLEEEQLPPLLEDPVTWPRFYKEEHTPTKHKVRTLTNFTDDSLGMSFNDNIYEDEKHCNYITIKMIISLIMAAKLKWIWAIDAFEAYFRVPLHSNFLVCPIQLSPIIIL